MQARLDDRSVTSAEAHARLRHVEAVRERARAASLAPSFALIALGALAVCHAVLATVRPHDRTVTLVWVGAIVAVRPVLRRLRRERDRRRGLEGTARLPAACAAGAVAAVALAVGVGADPLVSALAAAGAIAAVLSGMPALAAAAVAVGLIGDLAIANGLAAATGEFVAGAGLLAAGLVARERDPA
jgi:hypothetical protein